MFIFLLVIFLPLIEIVGFILIGGKIGAELSLLWVIVDVVAGFTVLRTLGPRALHQIEEASQSGTPIEELFNGLCILAGALLLIFPGFVSDFMALPLLVPVTRRWIFLFLKHRHGKILNGLGKTSQGFTHWYGAPHKNNSDIAKTIEGEFRNMDEDKHLS